MIQENHQQGFAGFAEAFGDLFGDILAKKDVAAEQKKHESKREPQPIQVETRTRLTGERVREIVSDQVEELADFVESLLLDQREILERQHAAQLDQLSKIVALVGQMHGPEHRSDGLADRRICVGSLREKVLDIGHAAANGVAVEELIKQFLLQLDEVSLCPCMTMGTGGFGAAA
ncbi:hypothetical protein OKW45_006630 [Paraburkholderia sp. WSM4175]|uniref:hypothetical protein n=1 Tax=Paraburkholderia sp. WSM4175 TaxID=2991072 RepID=UPI003D1AA04F